MAIEPEGGNMMGRKDAERARVQWLQRMAAQPPLSPQQQKAGAHWQQRQRDEQIWQLERDGVPHLLGEPSQPNPEAKQPTRAEREAAQGLELAAMRDNLDVNLQEYLQHVWPGDRGPETVAFLERRQELRRQAAAGQPPAPPQPDPAAERRAQLQARHVVLSLKFRSATGNAGHKMRAELAEIERELFSGQ